MLSPDRPNIQDCQQTPCSSDLTLHSTNWVPTLPQNKSNNSYISDPVRINPDQYYMRFSIKTLKQIPHILPGIAQAVQLSAQQVPEQVWIVPCWCYSHLPCCSILLRGILGIRALLRGCRISYSMGISII